MRRWGEIARIWYKDRLYILTSFKLFNEFTKGGELYFTSFSIGISTKTSKKTRDKKLDKWDKRYQLLESNDNPISLIKEVVYHIKTYLDIFTPYTLSIGLYGYYNEKKKRYRLYTSVFESLGYKKVHEEGKFNSYNMSIIFQNEQYKKGDQ